MIPRVEGFAPVVDVDAARLWSISSTVITNGPRQIFRYTPSLYAEASWPVASSVLEEERSAVMKLDATCDDPVEFDREAWRIEEGTGQRLELGVRATVIALCAAGCPTFACCRGHDETAPYVLMASDAGRLPLLEDAVRSAQCSLRLEGEGLLRTSAASLAEMLDLSAKLIVRAPEFDAVPLPVPRDLVTIPAELPGVGGTRPGPDWSGSSGDSIASVPPLP